MKLEHLKREAVESGRGHPFVEALVDTLRARLLALLEHLESQAVNGGQAPVLYATGGRASEVRHLLTLITKTEGVPE